MKVTRKIFIRPLGEAQGYTKKETTDIKNVSIIKGESEDCCVNWLQEVM